MFIDKFTKINFKEEIKIKEISSLYLFKLKEKIKMKNKKFIVGEIIEEGMKKNK